MTENSKEQGADTARTTGRWAWLVFLGAIIVWALFYPALSCLGPSGTVELGTFGDSFGAFNALVSALAFAALVMTLWMQREELQLQRQELAETRKELARTAEQQEVIARHQENIVKAQQELAKAQDAAAHNLGRQRDIMKETYKAQKLAAKATILQAQAGVAVTRSQRDKNVETIGAEVNDLLRQLDELKDEP